MKTPNRNDPCPCGSGKKYKQCCQQQEGAQAAKAQAMDAAIPKAIQAALAHHQAGRLHQAEAIFQQILQAAPNHPDALHFAGVIAFQTGKKDAAVELISKAIRNNPSSLMHYNLGLVLRAQGKLDAAAESYRQALALKPDYVEAHNNLGNVLKNLGKLDEAIKHYRKVLSIKPNDAEAHNNLGNVLKDQGKLDEAIQYYRKAFLIKPGYVEAYNNLGNALREQGKFDEAIQHYRKALSLKPDLAEAHNNLGNATKDQGKLDEAIQHYRNALLIKPDYAEAHNNLGYAFLTQNKLEAAIECFHKALFHRPDFAEAYSNLGGSFQSQGKLEEAVESYRKALALKPDFANAYSNLLFLHSFCSSLEPDQYLSLARGWEQACLPAQDRQATHGRIFRRKPVEGRRLKVGYVSGDFRHHAVSYFIERLFALHDRERIELYAYSTQSQRDAVTERLQALVEHWVSVVGMSDAAARDRIEVDGIDVLIDLSGHTQENRLGIFARRAAPVQAHYLGYVASTGLTEMDYWIGDDILTPPEMDGHFSELVWRLPRVWVSYKTVADAPEPDWRPAGDGTVWVGSFNNLGKITAQTIALWARVLHALPEGRLLLKTKELASAANRQRILDAMASHGISPERIELQRDSSWADYMAYYNRLDIALDPVGGHGGGTITCDALWMGVPVIHALGNRTTSRFTASMLNAIGHAEWIAHSEAEYVDKVVTLARDVELRKALRPIQRSRMAFSPLCDARGLTLALENAYFEMFKRWFDKKNKT